MLLESDRLLIQALAQLSLSGVKNQAAKVDFYPMLLNPQSVEDSSDVPVGLINTVKRSLQPTVIIPLLSLWEKPITESLWEL